MEDYSAQTERIIREVMGWPIVRGGEPWPEADKFPVVYSQCGADFEIWATEEGGCREFYPFEITDDALEAAHALAKKLNARFYHYFDTDKITGRYRSVVGFRRLPLTCKCDHPDECHIPSDRLKAENIGRLIIEVLDELERGKQKED